MLQAISYTDADFVVRRKDAAAGSRRLRNAILRSLGHAVPSRTRKPAATVFLAPHSRRGRPKGSPNKSAPKSSEIKALQRATSKVCRVRIENLLVLRRDRFVRARQLAMWICREDLSSSYPEIGRHFRRDHTTVIYACRRIEALVAANDRVTILRINAIRAKIA